MSAKTKEAIVRVNSIPVQPVVYGSLHGKDTMFFRVDAGEASDSTGRKYELSTNVGGSTPIVRSLKTGLWFALSWSDIIKMAKDKGIDAHAQSTKPKGKR